MHEFFILICLFNFLIAIVSQSYDSIMDNQARETTMSKTFLNNEAAIILDTLDLIFAKKIEQTQTFHITVCMDEYEAEGDEFQGFVGTMKAHMTKEVKTINKSVKMLQKKFDDVQLQNETMVETKFAKLEAKLNNVLQILQADIAKVTQT